MPSGLRPEVVRFCRAVSVEGAESYFSRLDFPPTFQSSILPLAKRIAAAERSSTVPMSDQERRLLDTLTRTYLPDHDQFFQMGLWHSEVFGPFAELYARAVPPVGAERASQIVNLVAAWKKATSSYDEFTKRDEAYEATHGYRDEWPYANLGAMLDWRYYREIWESLGKILTREELTAFVNWANVTSGCRGEHGLVPPWELSR